MPKRIWLLCHRWVALSLGGILILSGFSGAFLVAARPLDKLLHPELFRAESAGAGQPASFESLRRNLAAGFGPQASFTFRPPRDPGETMQVRVRAAGAWDGTVYLDPTSGREQGRRADDEGIVALVYKLHSALMLEQTGKAILAWTALAYLVLTVSGLIVWWPRKWPPSLRMAFDKGTLRALFDLHRNGGAILALALAVCMASGAYMAWRPIGGWITLASGQTAVVAPKLPTQPAGAIQPRSLDELAAAAQAAFPDGSIGYFLYTPRTDRPLAIRMSVPDDPHPNGRSTVWLDPRDGKVLAAQRWNELDPGARINSVLYPLHTGELGGVAGETVVALLGLGLGTLGISGVWLWWRRRSLRLHGPRIRPSHRA